jgi:hypothetical protein
VGVAPGGWLERWAWRWAWRRGGLRSLVVVQQDPGGTWRQRLLRLGGPCGLTVIALVSPDAESTSAQVSGLQIPRPVITGCGGFLEWLPERVWWDTGRWRVPYRP